MLFADQPVPRSANLNGAGRGRAHRRSAGGTGVPYSPPVFWRRVFQALRPAHEAMDTTRVKSDFIHAMARSFVFKFLPLAIRQPRHMVDYRHHFAFIILNECHLRAIDFEEEICFRFGIKIQSTW
jgi:hypothetical protein